MFVSGRWVEKHWREARELADEPLIEFGNHSYRHPAFSRMSIPKVREEIDATDRLIAALGRQSVGVRPPFGDWAAWLPEATGGQPVVLWDVVSGDAGGHISADAIVNKVSAGAQPGVDRRVPHQRRGARTPSRRCPGSSAGCAPAACGSCGCRNCWRLEGAEIVKAQPRRVQQEAARCGGPRICATSCRTICTITRQGRRTRMRIRKARPAEARRQADWIVAIDALARAGVPRAGAGPLAGAAGARGDGCGWRWTATR